MRLVGGLADQIESFGFIPGHQVACQVQPAESVSGPNHAFVMGLHDVVACLEFVAWAAQALHQHFAHQGHGFCVAL